MKFSQYDEQEHILKAISGIERGRLLDLGAWHATQFSNSRALIEAGWEAILVEPSPEPLLGLIREYAGNERVKIIGGAVGFERSLVKFHATADAVSTSDERNYETWKQAGGFYGEFYAPVFTLGDLLNQFGGNFDFVNIDTEGSSVDVFAAWMQTGSRPKCFCVEHDSRIVELAQHAEQRGYQVVHTNGTNLVVVSV